MARPGDSLRHSLLILAAIGERLQTTHKLAGDEVRTESVHALQKLEALEAELNQQSVIEFLAACPPMESMGKRKLIQLQGDGYIINGVALYHPETGQRVLVDYLGYVGWHKSKTAPPEVLAEVADALDRISNGALSDYEGRKVDEAFLRTAAKLLREIGPLS